MLWPSSAQEAHVIPYCQGPSTCKNGWLQHPPLKEKKYLEGRTGHVRRLWGGWNIPNRSLEYVDWWNLILTLILLFLEKTPIVLDLDTMVSPGFESVG